MFHSPESLSANSKVWVYQSDRRLNADEKATIEERAKVFVSAWTSHGAEVHGSFLVQDDYFLILMADEEKSHVSGCSTDSSVHLVKELEKEIGVQFFNRLQAVCIDPNGQAKLLSKPEAKDLCSDDWKVYNNLVQTKEELESNRLIDFQESWLAS